MPKSFLLRFQETGDMLGDPGTVCGTRTITKINPGDSDNDPGNADLCALPRPLAHAGSCMLVAGESTAPLPAGVHPSEIVGLPLSGSTGTSTRIHRETGDHNNAQFAAMRAVPPCF